MKTKKLLFIGLAVSLFASCAQDETTDEVNNAKQSDITVSVDGFESDGASKSARQSGKKKTALLLGSSGLAFSWTQGDVTGVFAENSGQQMPMKMIEGQGTGNKAYFEREDYELKSGVRYVGYYPVVDRLMQEPFININYEGQVQEGNGLYSHLAKYDYLVSNPVTVEKTNTADFYFNHQGAILRLMIDMPEADTYSSVTLSAEDNAFTTKAVMDLFNTAEPIQSGTTSKSVTLGFKENSVSTTSDNLQLEVWIMISPADFTSREMTVTVKSATGKDDVVYTVSPEKNFVKGKAYIINVKNDESDEWVDLGLPSGTLWAKKNVGAENYYESGNYYGWGDVTGTKTVNSASSYGPQSYRNANTSVENSYGTTYYWQCCATDSRYSSYDIAAYQLGGKWTMPTPDQVDELIKGTNYVSTTLNNVRGFKFTNKRDESKWIFIPAAGYKLSGTLRLNGYLYVWTSEIHWYQERLVGGNYNQYNYVKRGIALTDYYDGGSDVTYGVFNPSYGFPVRPVMNK